MRVAGVQFHVAWEDPEENFARVTPFLEEAARTGAELIALPEMFATGFSMNVERIAGEAPRIHAFLSRTSRRLGVTLVGGVVEKEERPEGVRGKNLAVVYGPTGVREATYQKIHPFSYGLEHRHYLGGDRLAHLEVRGVRVVPLICYDLRFPEVFRVRASRTDLIVVIANWPAARRFAWSALLVARAIENQAYVLGVNGVGHIGEYDCAGDSVLLDPLGQQLDGARNREGIVAGEVDPGQVRVVRDRYPFLKDRRRGVYRRLEADLEP